MFIFMSRFIYRSRRGCLNSLRKEEKTELASDEMEKLMKHSLHVLAKESEGEREGKWRTNDYILTEKREEKTSFRFVSTGTIFIMTNLELSLYNINQISLRSYMKDKHNTHSNHNILLSAVQICVFHIFSIIHVYHIRVRFPFKPEFFQSFFRYSLRPGSNVELYMCRI